MEMIKDIEELTEADFRAYERVRAGGRWNMAAEASFAMRDAGLDEATYWGVLWNYSALAKAFGKAKARACLGQDRGMRNVALIVRPCKTYRVVLGPRRDPMCCECHEVKARSKDGAKELARRRCPSWWVVRECSVLAE